MFGYIVRRLIAAVLVLFAVSIATFTLFFIGPSDPARAMCGEKECSAERLHAIREGLGLNKPKVQQYIEFLTGMLKGRTIGEGTNFEEPCPWPCFGYSYKQSRPVTEIMAENIPVTISIALGGVSLMLIIGVILGVFAAINRGTAIDKGLVASSLVMSSFPYYIVALLAFLFLAVRLGIFPRGGYHPLFGEGGDFFKWVGPLILAWLVVGIYNSTAYARYTRASMVEVLSEDYIRTARAKGLSSKRVYFKHALRAALAPIVTIFGLDIAGFVAGTIFTERIFSLQGLGYLAVESVFSGDLPVIMGTVMFSASLIVVANIVVDVTYSVIDPRVRLG